MGVTTKKHDLRPRTEQKVSVLQEQVLRTTVSFYRYVQIADPAAFRERLLSAWGELGCLGRIYVAHEGINAQMNVPTDKWPAFDTWNQAQYELQGVPYKVAVEEGEAPSFYKLAVKVRKKIVADGLDDSTFDPSNTGAYLTAEEMNQFIDDPDAVVIDMRNAYESEVGHFEGAITPDVDTFREELKVVPEKYRIHKNKKIALYCTGGIRCEKASAWLKHNGFADVRHLKGGIIEYKHQVDRLGLPNKFRGKNFVFDERLGERISDEVIATCHLCKRAPSDTHYHCQFQPCHELFIGCEGCVRKGGGYCTRLCRMLDTLPPVWQKRYAHYRNKKRNSFSKGRKLKAS